MRLSNFIATGILASVASAASLTQVSGYGGTVPMYIYVPDQQTTKAVVVVIHSCGSTAQNYFQNSLIPWHQGSDQGGYITVWPSSPNSGGCWDVSSKASLTHNGGGDSNSIAKMITYTTQKYDIPADQVFVTGGSSGAMMSNVMAATYPELISAVSLYSGVPAGCFVSSSGGVDQWNNTCSQGQAIFSPQIWGDTARNMEPGYTGARPKMQIWHGSADTTLYPPNFNETIKQWTNVFNASETPTMSTPNTPQSGYTTMDYGPMLQGIYAQGVGHSVPSHLEVSEAWFGLA